MILTCPSCGTQYVVKDGAIPPQGRQVRCASCKHSWHQDPEPQIPSEDAPLDNDETIAEAAIIEPRSGPEAEERAYEEAALADNNPIPESTESPAPYAPGEPLEAPLQPQGQVEEEPAAEAEFSEPVDQSQFQDDDFSPFAERDLEEPRRRGPFLKFLIAILLIAALAAAFWFFAPPQWKQQLGIMGAAETPLQLMMTHSDRQKLASGNELLAVTGRVINPTDESQPVPPIQAQLRSRSGRLVYSWTIAPPARTLPPRASATFNSAEVNVPTGGDELTITLGPKA